MSTEAEKQKPVGRFAKFTDGIWREVTDGSPGQPLYTHPQPKQEQGEPVAWMTIDPSGEEDDIWYSNPEGKLLAGWTYKPLYTTPQHKMPKQDLEAPLTLNGVPLYPQPKQEPVGYFSMNDYGRYEQNEDDYGTPFYTHPQPATWAGLTDEDRLNLCRQFPLSLTYNQINAIEQALKEKNNG